MHILILLICVLHNSSVLCRHSVKDTIKYSNGFRFNKNVSRPNDSICTMEVKHYSGIYLQHWQGLLQPNFVHYDLVFENTTVISALSTVIRPLKWVWTYRNPNSVHPYLHWQVDFPILSFGLLSAKCLEREVFIHINVSPSDCTVALGQPNASLAIATALNAMTQKYLVPFHEFGQSYNYSSWCYLIEIPGARDTIAYQFALYFLYPVDFLRYKCCNSSFNFYNKTVEVSCPDVMTEKLRDSTLGPYVIGLVLLCYCPLILCRCGDTMAATGRNILAQNSYEDLDDLDKRKWVYLNGNSPISLSHLLCGLCGRGWKHPLAVSRLRRALYILFSPIVIFLQFLLYRTYQGDMTLDLIDHGVPMGFLSMLGGVERSKRLFAPMLGGPYCLLLLYYITGFIFVLIPRSLGDLIQKGALDSKYAGLSPLILCTERIEEISMVSVNHCDGYKRLSRLLLARFYLIMKPRFWIDVIRIVWHRIKRHYGLLMKHLPKPIFFILSCVMTPLYIICGSLEICLSFVYYSIPLIWFLCLVINGFVTSATEYIQKQSSMNMPHSGRLVMRIGLYTLIGPFLLLFMYGSVAIYLASFSIVGEIIVFLFYALILFPSSSFGYLFFGGALIYYVWKLLKGIGDVYYDLLTDLFETCTNLDCQQNIPKLHNSTVMIKAIPGLQITSLSVNDTTIKLTEEQVNMIQPPSNFRVRKYVHYRKHIPGISRSLFMYVVRKTKPVHITVFQAIFRIGLIVLLVIVSMRMSMNSIGMSSAISEVMHVLFIVVIGALPRVLEITIAQNDKAVHRDIHLRMLEMLILEYNDNNMEANSLSRENALISSFDISP